MESGPDTDGLLGCQLQVSEGLRKDEEENRVGLGSMGAVGGTKRIIETRGRAPKDLVPPMSLFSAPAFWA